MCTAVHFDNFFGRNLDLEFSYNEHILLTPRNFTLAFRTLETIKTHYAIIGTGIVAAGYPLYFDAMNEKGLCAAGLNFPDNAHYTPICHGADNIAPFELIPYILSQCATVRDTQKILTRINIADIHFNEDFPNSPLHWMFADGISSIVAEQTKEGLKVYENPVGVLTNNPTFDFHLTNLVNYINVTSEEPENRFSKKLPLARYSRGMGGMGLPGDLSSASRFVRAAFTLLNSTECNISQFFHILDSVKQQKGTVCVGDKYEYTVYSSCYDTKRLVYYYTTYENRRITGIDMNDWEINADALCTYALCRKEDIKTL